MVARGLGVSKRKVEAASIGDEPLTLHATCLENSLGDDATITVVLKDQIHPTGLVRDVSDLHELLREADRPEAEAGVWQVMPSDVAYMY